MAALSELCASQPPEQPASITADSANVATAAASATSFFFIASPIILKSGRCAPFPGGAFASAAFLLYCTKARGQYSTAAEKRNPLQSGTGDGRRKRSEREPAAAPKRKRDDGHHIEAAPR